MKTIVLAGVFAIALAGCDRTHMNANYGGPNRDAFRAQVIQPDAGNVVKPEQPLDPEEAATVAKTYQRSLAPKNAEGTATGRNQILVVPAGGTIAAPRPEGMVPPQ